MHWGILSCRIPPSLTGCAVTCSGSGNTAVQPLLDYDRVWTAYSSDGCKCVLKLLHRPYPAGLHRELAKASVPAMDIEHAKFLRS